MYYERAGQMGVEKYLRKNCYQHIKCIVANSLAAFMWRRLLNSTALVTLTHRGPMRVSDGTSTQAVTWTIDKWRAKIIQREIYNVPMRKGGSKNEEKNTVAIKNWICNQTWESIYKNWFLRTVPRTSFFRLNQFTYIFLSSGSILLVA